MKKSNKLVVVSAIIVLVVIISTVIYAYYTYQKSVKNTIILGYNEIQVNEVYNPPLEMKKGITFQKEPTIQNIGNVDCYVRVKYVVSDSRIESGLNIFYNDESLKYNSENFTYNESDRLLLL